MSVLGDIAKKLITGVIADGIGTVGKYLIGLALGDDSAKDGDVKHVAREMLEAGRFAAERIAKERKAADELPDRLREMAAECAKVLKAFDAGDAIIAANPNPLNASIIVEITPHSMRLLERAGVAIEDATDGERAVFGPLTWRLLGHVVTSGTSDRNVPPELQTVIDAEDAKDRATA